MSDLQAKRVPGWSGRMDQLTYFLRIMGADYTLEKDEDGKERKRYHIGHPDKKGGVFTFLGDSSDTADVIIDGETVYYVNGKPAGLAAGLGATSYGLRVHVIC